MNVNNFNGKINKIVLYQKNYDTTATSTSTSTSTAKATTTAKIQEFVKGFKLKRKGLGL
jgi:hypothetical protein